MIGDYLLFLGWQKFSQHNAMIWNKTKYIQYENNQQQWS